MANVIIKTSPFSTMGPKQTVHASLTSAYNQALLEIYTFAEQYRKRYGEVEWLPEVSKAVNKGHLKTAIEIFNKVMRSSSGGAFLFDEVPVLNIRLD